MKDIKVCRYCIIMNVRLYDIRSYPLELYYESVLGKDPLYSNLPPYACYECAALVRKFYLFKQKCLRSQAILYGISDDNGKLKVADIHAIDRKSLLITSNLEVSALEVDIKSMHTEKEIKLEPDSEEGTSNIDENDDFKVEFHAYEDVFPINNVQSSDDEPLSHHKEKKIQKKEVDVESLKEDLEVEFNDDDDMGLKDDVEVELKEDIEGLEDLEGSDDGISEPVKKKKRGRPRNKVINPKRQLKNPNLISEGMNDFEQYTTVITLSVEEQMEEIKKRKTSSNYINSPYQCDLCYKGFIDTDAWKHHVSKHSPSSGSIECPICKFRFKTKRALQKHAANHEKKYACKTCPYISTNTTQAKQHQGWHKGITFKCKYCDEIFTIWTSYMSHTRIKHPSEFICGVCGYSFISKLGLAMHKTMMHKDVQENAEGDNVDGPYCAECDVKFISTEAYKRHMVMSVKHTGSTIKGCRSCGATFESSEELRLHHRKEHARKRPAHYCKKKPSVNITWPANCEHCSEVIANARDYWTHFRRVHPDKKYPIQKNYVCDICGKSFRGNAFLVYHRRTHFEERPYKCCQCDKAFFNRTNLHVHEKIHSDNRPYPCNICFKAFKCKGALNRHTRVHEELFSDIRPFPCSACSKTFKFKGALDRHFLSHTGHKPYSCELCGKAFSQSNSRKLHVRTVHLKQPHAARTRRGNQQNPQPPIY